MRVGTRIGAVFVVSLVVAASLAAVSWVGASDLASTGERVDHTNDVLKQLDLALEDLIDVETGARGYAITGQPSFLAPYENGRARTMADLAALRGLVAGDPGQLPLAARLEELGRRRIELATRVVELRRSEGLSAAAALLATGQGRAATDEIRVVVAAMRDKENRLLSERTARARRRSREVVVLAGASMAALVLLMLLGALWLGLSITRPLVALVDSARRFGRGETPLPPEPRDDEIGELSRELTNVFRRRGAAEAELRALIEQAPDGVFVSDATGRFVDVNPVGCRMLGYAREELLARSIADVVPPAEQARQGVTVERLRAGEAETSEWQLVRKDGTLLPSELSMVALEGGRLLAFVRDVSERKRAREALEASENRFRTLADAVPQIVWITRPDGWNTYFNQRWVEYTGLTLEQSYGHGWNIPFHPDDKQRAWDAWQNAVRTDGVYSLECRLRRADGAYRWWLIRGVSLHDPDGKVIGWFGTCTDVDDIKRTEERLRESEEQFRLMFEEAPIGMALVSLDGRFARVNAVLCEIVGYAPAELSGLTFQDITHRDDLDADLELVGRLGRGEIPRYQLEKRYVRKDGSIADILLSVSLLRDRDGAPVHYIAQIEDITGRKRVEAERERLLHVERQHRGRLQAIRESALAISALHAAGAVKVPDVLRSIVEQARRLTGAEYGALGIGTDPSRRFAPWIASGVSPEEAERIGPTPRPLGVLGLVAADDESLRLRRIRDHPGSVGFPPHYPPMDAFLGVPIRHRGDPVGNLYLARRPGEAPFTDDDQSVVELLADHAAIAIENARLYDELQAALRAREELLAVVSHDLRNPLSAISIREQLLARDGDPRLAAHAQSVRRSVATLERMVRGLLDAASLDAGQLRLDPGEHELEALVDEVVDVISPIAQGRGVAIERRVPPGVIVHADRERLIQVLFNLVGNAVKFTAAEGAITISAERSSSGWLVAVADTGAGISEDALPHVFERYFTKGGGHGTGLGLHIAKALVEAHGGRIWVTSEPGVGSTFFFTVPDRRIEQTAHPPP